MHKIIANKHSEMGKFPITLGVRLILTPIFLFNLLCSQIEIGQEAPTFYLRTLDNQSFFLSKEIDKGRPILLNFFATWCIPCKKEIPGLDSLLNHYSTVTPYLVNVSIPNSNALKQSPQEVSIFVNNLNTDIPVLLDQFGKAFELYGNPELPATFIINQFGDIYYNSIGFTDSTISNITHQLNNLISEDKQEKLNNEN